MESDEEDAYSHWTTLGIAARCVIERANRKESTNPPSGHEPRLFILTGAGPAEAVPTSHHWPAIRAPEFVSLGKSPDAEAPGSWPREVPITPGQRFELSENQIVDGLSKTEQRDPQNDIENGQHRDAEAERERFIVHRVILLLSS